VHENDTPPVARPATLVCGQALADRLTTKRRVAIAEALAYVTPITHVAAALDLEIAELAAGLRSPANRHHQHTCIPAAARDEVHALPDNREGGR
jgi:hypothetical protein